MPVFNCSALVWAAVTARNIFLLLCQVANILSLFCEAIIRIITNRFLKVSASADKNGMVHSFHQTFLFLQAKLGITKPA